MPNPKRRHSKARGRKRRTNWKMSSPNVVDCKQCGQKRLQHCICPGCGHYNGEEILSIAQH